MRKLLGLFILGFVFATAEFSPVVSQQSQAQDVVDKFNSGTKPKTPPSKSFSSGQPPKQGATPPVSDKKYGSGNTPKPPDNKAPPTTDKKYGSGTQPGVTPNNPPTKKYGSGTEPAKKDVGEKPKTGNFDHKAGQAQKKEESKAAFLKGKEPASSYVAPNGKTVQIDPRDQKIQNLRSQLSEEKWHNRELRQQNFYATYYSRPVVVHYHDPYSNLFWFWLLDRSIEQQAMWAYHHRASMDAARYNDLLAKNAELAARVRAMEQQNMPRNPAYQPTGMADADLMYDDGYVRAAYNPAPAPVTHNRPHHVDDGTALRIMLYIFLGLAIVALIVWLLFVKKWGD